MLNASSIRERYTAVSRDLNERARRLFGAAEARTAGHVGITASSRTTGLARSTIGSGLKDLGNPDSLLGSIPRLLELLQYRRQVNRKTLEGSRNPDRDAQLEHINAAVVVIRAAVATELLSKPPLDFTVRRF